jgi:hypothetical protein
MRHNQEFRSLFHSCCRRQVLTYEWRSTMLELSASNLVQKFLYAAKQRSCTSSTSAEWTQGRPYRHNAF